MRRIAVGFCLLLLFAPGPVRAADWATYHNARFGFSVDYPPELLAMQPPPKNADGRVFRSPDGRARVIAFASQNALDSTVAGLYRRALADYQDADVTYRKREADWFVISGFRGGRVFYEYVAIARRRDSALIGRLVAGYPAARKPVMDPVIERMQASFARSFLGR